jgi:hypothetical protein
MFSRELRLLATKTNLPLVFVAWLVCTKMLLMDEDDCGQERKNLRVQKGSPLRYIDAPSIYSRHNSISPIIVLRIYADKVLYSLAFSSIYLPI